MSEKIKSFHPAKKFYFLDYFHVLLESVQISNEKEVLFEVFKELKDKHKLGESKYKKLTIDEDEILSPTQENRYRYTFRQVINEAEEYGLIVQDGSYLASTKEGKALFSELKRPNGFQLFNQHLLRLMEDKYKAFHYLVKFLYQSNPVDGRLIFPHYSPRQLKMKRASIRTTRDIVLYTKKLIAKLEEDLQTFLNNKKSISFAEANGQLIQKLIDSDIIGQRDGEEFDPKKYNAIIKRCSDFWTSYFLREIYGYDYSMSAFEVWSYRAKQIGIVHVTEFFPGFTGKVIFPTSIVSNEIKSGDFTNIYRYSNKESLYVHHPPMRDDTREIFVKYLVDGYFKLRKSSRTYFVNLSSLRELVCFNMKISEFCFSEFLNSVYSLNLSGELAISISLEVDKLPEETKAMYLKREPVFVGGKFRNIIAIDIAKGKKI